MRRLEGEGRCTVRGLEGEGRCTVRGLEGEGWRVRGWRVRRLGELEGEGVGG